MIKIINIMFVYFTFSLAFGIFYNVQAQNNDELREFTRKNPSDLYEGLTYERFNSLTTFKLSGEKINNQQCWNSCENITGINKFINETMDVNNPKGCLGEVNSCSVIDETTKSKEMTITRKLLRIFKIDGAEMIPPESTISCPSCECTCRRTYEPSNNKTYPNIPELLDSICLDNVTANLADNFVVTGVRLTRLNNTLAFQIQEGQILSGIIDQSTLRWKPLPKKCHKIGQINLENRTIILDDVILPKNWVATGVAFQRYSETDDTDKPAESVKGDPFYLSVIGNRLDKQLNLKHESTEVFTEWDFSLSNRKNLINDEMGYPLDCRENAKMSSRGENYITFEMIRLDNYVREYDIPYVDSQYVRMKTIPGDFDDNDGHDEYPTILRGIGLYWKSHHAKYADITFGGYIAPSIFVPQR